MSAFTVLLTDRAWPSIDLERQILAEIDAELIEAPDGEEATLIALAPSADAIATCWAEVTANVINAAVKCRHIARLGIGLDNIDIAAATARGIPVTNVPDYCIAEVADHTLGLLLSLARRITQFDREAKAGTYDLRGAGPMYRLAGRTLGLLGFGRIGAAVRERALGFGLHVIAHTPSGNDHGTGCEMVSLDELLARSDYLSLHAPLNDTTHRILNAETFARIKRGLFLINTSRGGLIDQAALGAAIADGTVAGAGLDVFDPEPPDLDDPLIRNGRVIATPHAAFSSEESLLDLRERVCRQIVQVLQGERPSNVVNPEYAS